MAVPSQHHRDILELIPWYVNGTLAEREMDHVSTHLRDCTWCQRAVDEEVAMAQGMRADPPGLGALLDRRGEAFANLQEDLHRSPARSRRNYVPAMAAAIVVVAILAFFTGRVSVEPTFELMMIGNPHAGPVVQLIFHPQTSEQDIRNLMVDGEAQLLGSPSPRGVYRVGLPSRTDPRAYASRIREHPAVRWAEVEL